MKQEFKMTQKEMDKILSINKTTADTVMMMGGVDVSNHLTNAINIYWEILGNKYGFNPLTAEGSSKGNLYFLAEPKKAAKKIDKYDSLQKIVDQLEMCEYECIGGNLVNNIAFIKLKELAKTEKR